MNTIDDLTLHPSKIKHFMLLFVCFAFTAIGIWMDIGGKWIGFLCAAFFGFGTLIFMIQLFPGSSYMRLYKDGFEYCVLFRKHSLKWKDINEFGIINNTYLGISIHKMVGFNFVSSYDRSRFGRNLGKQLAGFEAGLPDTYGKKADALLALMLSYWSIARQTEQDAAANP